MSRIVLATWGSLGDLHPYIAVGRALRNRGHAVTIATCAEYQAKVEGEGLAFAPYAPDLAPLLNDREALRRAYDEQTGTEYVVRNLVLPYLAESHRDLLASSRGADLLVGHPLTYAVPIVSEQLGIPWLSVALQPAGLLSAYDPPYFPRAAWIWNLTWLGSRRFALLFRFARWKAGQWSGPIRELRRNLGLPPSPDTPLFAFSAHGTMAWFSRLLGQPQPDWPARTLVTGFPFYDRFDPARGISASLTKFLQDGEPPLVFTLGSSAVMEAGDFYRQSLDAVLRMGRRAVMLTGIGDRNQFPNDPPPSVHVADYAPYSELLPHAAAVIHQGGIGTTAQVMRAGRPMLVVPFSHDQPDNARRIARLGAGRVLPRPDYNAERAAAELEALLSNPAYAARAAAIGQEMSAEDGTATACRFIEECL